MGCCFSAHHGDATVVSVEDPQSVTSEPHETIEPHEIAKPTIALNTYENIYEFGEGAYLVYEPKDMGLLSLVWSKERVTNAIGHFRANKAIPEFKYSHNGGRTILKRNADEKKMYYQGWAEFIKQGLATYCCHEIHVLPHASAPHLVQIIMLETFTNALWSLREGQWWSFSPELCQAICIAHPDCEEFNVGTHAPSYFMELGRVHGHAFQVGISAEQVADAKRFTPSSGTSAVRHMLSLEELQMEPESGAYLVFSIAPNSLSIVWSQTQVPGALAYFKPTRTVPQHSYKKGGVRELRRGCDDRRVVIDAWAEFLKIGLTQWAANRIYIYEPRVLVVFLERSTNAVHRRMAAGWMDVDLSKMDQCAVMHTDVMAFEVQTMAPSLFTQKGASNGKVFDVRRLSSQPSAEEGFRTELSLDPSAEPLKSDAP